MDYYFVQKFARERFKDLHLCFCGYESCKPLHGWGPAVRTDYIIHYILGGKGIYRVAGQTWDLREGEGFLIEPGTLTYYQADSKEPWTYFWICFNGDLVPELLGNLGLGGDRLTFRSRYGEELKKVIFTMLKNHSLTMNSEFLLEGQLYLLFSILLRDTENTLPSNRVRESDYIRAAIEYIQNNYFTNIKVTDIAAYVGVNRSYLYTLFKSELNISPQQYLTTFRLSRAEELLKNTGLPIEYISASCGYQSPLVFSKSFKKRYHTTPLKFRQHEWNYNSEKIAAQQIESEDL